jgi:AAA+ superfamily predicted ATPase
VPFKAGDFAELGEALRRLDRRLDAALRGFEALQGGPVHDRFRGLCIAPQQVVSDLARPPGSPAFSFDARDFEPLWPSEEGSIAAWLAETFQLSGFELDALLIAIAPEYDLRYERIFAYLQDDVTRKRPTVDLVLNLLTFSPAERLEARAVFSVDAPLGRHRLLELFSDSQHPHAPLLAQYMRPDGQMLRYLLGDPGVDERLLPYVRRQATPASMAELPVDEDTRAHLSRLADVLRSGRHGWLHGPAGIGKSTAAAAIAHELDAILIQLDGQGFSPADAGQILLVAAREAWLRSGILYVGGVDAWVSEPAAVRRLAAFLAEAHVPVIFGSRQAAPGALLAQMITVELPALDVRQRAHCWQASLARLGAYLDAAMLEKLACLFQLTPAQIECAATQAVVHATPQSPPDGLVLAMHPLTFEECTAAARMQSTHLLAGLAEKVDARATWDDIILSEDALAQLKELCQRVEHRHKVLHEWGFARRSSRGLGTAALFAGPSGTGKTMAAEVVANALGLDLYRINLAGVVSKYIGETEKNLDRIFAAAEGAILFFDEADALFGKRTEVRDSHDRYANQEVSYLLQKMEQYPGIAILATNLRQNLDEAFVRRLAFIVQFPFPDEAMRRRIWDSIWPVTVGLAEDVELDILAKQLKFSGGSIRNIALAATYFAAHAGSAVRKGHVVQAADREARKFGKNSVPLPANTQGG